MEEEKYIFHLTLLGGPCVRHNLNVMHIEKKAIDNIIGTLLNLDGKAKDNS